MTIVSHQYDHVVGVDTHADTHTLAIIDALGALKKVGTFPTTTAGLARAVTWIKKYAPGTTLIAMEGTGSYGSQFCTLLQSESFRVSETKPPKRGVRRSGKTDEIDAEHAARYALALPVKKLIDPRELSGSRIVLNTLLTRRESLKRQAAAVKQQLLALLRSRDFGIDARKMPRLSQIVTISQWRARSNDTETTAKLRKIVSAYASEYVSAYRALGANLKEIQAEVEHEAAWLLEETGVGPCVAARFLASWSHAGRFHSADAFARHAGVAPIPASSGKVNRHRLHRGGDRKLNNALWTIAFYRFHHPDTDTQAFIEKHRGTKSDRDIIRILKHHVARKLFRLAERHAHNTQQPTGRAPVTPIGANKAQPDAQAALPKAA